MDKGASKPGFRSDSSTLLSLIHRLDIKVVMSLFEIYRVGRSKKFTTA